MAGSELTLPKDNLLIDAALHAGRIAMKYFNSSDNSIWYKNGNSPVSQADKEVDDYLRNHLLSAYPDHGWLSEETEDQTSRLNRDRLFIVDPIDGTRGFINGQKEWCISIAIVEGDRPIEAVLHSPPSGRILYASRSAGTFLSETGDRISHNTKPLVTGSKKLIETLNELPDRPFDVHPFLPSLAYRLAMVATGELDGAFARRGASEWDIAAADLILEESGCRLTSKSGAAIRYNQRKVTVPALVAASNAQHGKILTLANSTGILH